MKVKVKDIPRNGLKLDNTLSAEDLGLTDEEFKVATPLHVQGEVRKAEDSLVVDVEVEGKYEFTCARCLEPVIQKRVDDFKVYVDLDPQMDIVDIGDEVRQEMLVTFSPIVVCKEDCKGLCAGCGANLNLEKCKCINKK